MDSASQSMAWLRKEGKTAWRLEYYNAFSKRRVDVWGFADIIFFPPITLVQSTTATNLSAHLKKIGEIPEAKGWLDAGGAIQIHSWKRVSGRWKPKIITVGETPARALT